MEESKSQCYLHPRMEHRVQPIQALSKTLKRASQVALVVKNPAANAGDIRDMGSIPGSGRSPGGGHSDSLQCSCLENCMGRRAWWATVHSVAKNRTRLNDLACTHATLLTSYTCRWMDILQPLRHTMTQTKPPSLFALLTSSPPMTPRSPVSRWETGTSMHD